MPVTYAELPPHLTKPAIEMLVDSLQVEPGFAHILPRESERRLAMKHIFAGMTSTARRKGKIWAAIEDDTVLATGIWLAPGEYPSGWLESIRTIPHMIGLRSLGREKLQMLSDFDNRAKEHFPKTPCWYLQALGVHPSTQGKGIGSALMRYMLEEIGAHDCYLETGTPANVRFYERIGFEVLNAEAQLTPNKGPTHWTMMRYAQ